VNLKSISLTKSELKVVEELRAKYSGLPTNLLRNLEGLLRQTRVLLTRVNEGTKERRESQFALMGIAYRTHHLLLGGVQQITNPNKHVWGACLRGLIETFGVIAWVNEKPVCLPALIQGDGVKSGKLLNAAYIRFKGLKDDYARLSDWVHLSSVSLLLGHEMVNEDQGLVIFALPEPNLLPNEAQVAVDSLVSVCRLIYKDIEVLLDKHPEVISSGKLVGSIAWKGKPPDDI
jgi:hypothetical protein